jgi:oligopeptide transport system ATP-binding protein
LQTSLLKIQDLKTYFFTEAGIVKAVDGIRLSVGAKETVGLVGESGSGKTVTALSALRIVPRPGRIVSGSVKFDGADVLGYTEEQMRRLRGPKMAMVFQDPSSSLNPLYTVERQLTDILVFHQKLSRKEASQKAEHLLELVGIQDPRMRLKAYPHELSGGMKQRIAIARALSCEPLLLFADEPTTNLDVTIQAQVLELMKRLQESLGMSMVMITHDMGIIAEMTERVTIVYAGKVMEAADTKTVLNEPKHPYTEALLAAVPRVDRRRSLEVIPGSIPNLIDPPAGCVFHPRCKYAREMCVKNVPPLDDVGKNHYAACVRWKDLKLKGAR